MHVRPQFITLLDYYLYCLVATLHYVQALAQAFDPTAVDVVVFVDVIGLFLYYYAFVVIGQRGTAVEHVPGHIYSWQREVFGDIYALQV